MKQALSSQTAQQRMRAVYLGYAVSLNCNNLWIFFDCVEESMVGSGVVLSYRQRQVWTEPSLFLEDSLTIASVLRDIQGWNTARDNGGTYSHISDPGDCLCPLTIKHCGYLYQHPYGIISLRQGFLNLSSKYFERNNFTLIGNHTSFPLLTLAAFVWVWHLVDSGIYAPTTREFKALRVKKGRAGPQRKEEKSN